jgi:hypothetical protein
MTERLALHRRLRAYRLHHNLYVLVLLVLGMVVSVGAYARMHGQEGFGPELALAVATSLLASILVLLSETYVKFKEHTNDIFLEGIEKLGISNLHFQKGDLLGALMERCEHVFWASGYRLILTKGLVPQIEALSRRGVTCRLLVSPPWHEAYRSVYGDQERVMANYYAVLDAFARGAEQGAPTCEVRFTGKPLFSDTYKVDTQLVTGPYMHNRDAVHGRITANDFFTYELHKHSRLYDLVSGEYETVWSDADEVLDWDRYRAASAASRTEDLNDQQLQAALRAACVRRPPADADADADVAVIPRQPARA